MFLPEIWRLEIVAQISDVEVEIADGSFSKRVLLTIGRPAKRFELRLRDCEGFQKAIGK